MANTNHIQIFRITENLINNMVLNLKETQELTALVIGSANAYEHIGYGGVSKVQAIFTLFM